MEGDNYDDVQMDMSEVWTQFQEVFYYALSGTDIIKIGVIGKLIIHLLFVSCLCHTTRRIAPSLH